MFRDITPLHILILLAVILLLFGAKRLPDLTRSIGKSMRIMKTEVKNLRDDDDDRDESSTAPKAAPAPLEGSAVDEARREQRDEQQHRTS
ncbi:Sec-independent protein translocase subunit TatA [Pseudokineococcus basanitobsidens]|uniref:Sec-independent protein translocase protein TatA n=1 Tax=Pseudokineococcus basanitobsidens TaxID=1926649 RepID=A0ABU8RIT6_9ACTN